VEIVFDPAKDALNLAKHGVSLAASAEFEIHVVVPDDRRNYDEDRFNAFGLLAGRFYCLTFTVRNGQVRAISLRRARAREYRRHVV
jgi:uncharacterized DUF497 family protein